MWADDKKLIINELGPKQQTIIGDHHKCAIACGDWQKLLSQGAYKGPPRPGNTFVAPKMPPTGCAVWQMHGIMHGGKPDHE